MTADKLVNKLRQTLKHSNTLDNFECGYGSELGACVSSNHCIECEVYKLLSAFDGGEIDWRR